MGWESSSDWRCQSDVINHFKYTARRDGFDILAEAPSDKGLWVVLRAQPGNGCERREPFISLIKIGHVSCDPRKEYCYRTEDETEGMRDTSCPLNMIEMCGTPAGGYSQEWRIRCYRRHGKRPPDIHTIGLF